MRNLMANPIVQLISLLLLAYTVLTLLSKSQVGRFLLLLIIIIAVLCATVTWIVKNKPALAASMYARPMLKKILDPIYNLLSLQPPVNTAPAGNASSASKSNASKSAGATPQPANADEKPVHTLRFEDEDFSFEDEHDMLAQTVLGQEKVIDEVMDRLEALFQFRSNKETEARRHPPLCVVLLAGADGLGKVYLAKKLAAAVFSGGGIFKRDMTECKGASAASTALFGDAQGDGGMIAAVRKQPYHAVILENVDAAPAEILASLGKAIDASVIKDCAGKVVSLEHCLFVFTTSQCDSELAAARQRHPRAAPWIKEAREILAAKTSLPSNLCDRINVVGYFHRPNHRARAAIYAKLIERECVSQGVTLDYIAPDFLAGHVARLSPDRWFAPCSAQIREELLDDLLTARKNHKPLQLGGKRPADKPRTGDVKRMTPEEKILGKLTDLAALDDLLKGMEDSAALPPIDPEELKGKLKSMVIGQDHVIDSLVDDIRLQAEQNSQMRDKPIASVIFLGRSGVGKTELAKAMTECLYKDRKNMIVVDGSNCKEKHQLHALFGSDSVYSGSKPGTLTSAVKTNPKCVIVFDELDKAHPELQDLFLTMSGEGRVRDAYTNKDVDFTQAIIIVTTNADYDHIEKMPEQYPTDPRALDTAVKQRLIDIKAFPRTEVLGRFKRVYVFKNLTDKQKAAVTVLKMNGLAKKFGVELAYVDPRLLIKTVQEAKKADQFGMRAVEQIMEDLIAPVLSEAKRKGVKRVEVHVNDDGTARMEPAAPLQDASRTTTA